ncbi:hypothetical protein vBRpoSV10_16 [Ruegeria phage vB_RpoS-V10]|nr:hypothetical protein DSS3P8_017 [Roseobacter phage DSS3P8]AWY09138.1 hypothetical protein vBRpoSV10_16 [Ruegeria phage vB_RpoS-V10]
MTTFILGAIAGTFIPMPYQSAIRDFVVDVWDRAKELVKRPE